MYIITNRTLSNHKTLKAFGKTPNKKGPNELRMVKVAKSGRSWKVAAVRNELSMASKKALKKKYKLKIDINQPWYGSLQVACDLYGQAHDEGKSILFFVHGYNNDVGDALKAATEIEALYNVIVVPFTWPANGGGVSGLASYLSDKSDARASADALNRIVSKIQYFHLMLSNSHKERCQKIAKKKHHDNPHAEASLFSNLMGEECQVKISLLCHSMGNYVFKHTLSTHENSTSKLVFDNICLVAADANNKDHIDWVGQLDTRKRVYVVINENDSALKASRIKPGEEQKARLGHYTRKLNSPNTHYIDLTDAEHVGSEHTYFKGDTVKKNPQIHTIFNNIFNGEAAEQNLKYHGDNNSYKP
ncbi:MAG: alpha/beta hydrolase [Porticoccaceae bacterium]